jgi:cbb3-type cytochrome oxidase subunit 3
MMDWVALTERLEIPLLLLMVAIFSAIVLWAYSPRRRQSMDDSAKIPLRDDC